MIKYTKTIRAALIVILSGLLLFSCWKILSSYLDRRQTEKANSQAIDDFIISGGADTSSAAETTSESSTETSETEHTSSASLQETSSAAEITTVTTTEAATEPPSIWPTFTLNWSAMHRRNTEIKGWIWAYGTNINYPLLQGPDNQKYVKTLYDGVTQGSGGSIFIDYRCAADMSSRNTVIYGHNLNSGVMFGSLMYFLKASYTAAHPYFCIITESGVLKYEIFSVYRTDAYSDTYTMSFGGDDEFAAYLEKITARSLFSTGVSVSAGDSVVTLSTCTNNPSDRNERTVIHGRLVTGEIE